MTALIFKKLGLRFWSRILLFFTAVFFLHMIVKVITIFLVSESVIIDAGKMAEAEDRHAHQHRHGGGQGGGVHQREVRGVRRIGESSPAIL